MLDNLYENIGEKIKGWAKWICIAETIAAIIAGIILMVEEAFLYGALCWIAGPFAAWVSSWLLYAFGELVEKTVATEAHINTILQAMQDKEPKPKKTPTVVATNQTERTTKVAGGISGEKCNKEITHYPCVHCGHQIEQADAPYWCGKCGYLGPFANKCPQCNSGIKIFNTKK